MELEQIQDAAFSIMWIDNPKPSKGKLGQPLEPYTYTMYTKM